MLNSIIHVLHLYISIIYFQIRRGRSEGRPRRAGALPRRAAALPVLLQPLHEPHAIAALRV